MRASPIVSAVLLAAFAVFLGARAPGDEKKKEYPTFGSIERLDPRFDKLIGKDARMEKLADGYDWSEGPVWVKRDGGFLLFSDIPKNSVMKFQEGKGVSLFLKPAGYTGEKA